MLNREQSQRKVTLLTSAGGGVMKCCGLGGAVGHRTQGCVYGCFGAFLLGTGAHMWLLALKQAAEDEDTCLLAGTMCNAFLHT